jgi:HlyD family secretion protein
MKRRVIISLGLVVVAGAVTAGFLLHGHSAYSATYRTVLVDKGDIESTVSSTGTLGAVTTVQVGAQVSGQIAELHADFNSHVRKGQLVARLDPALALLAVRQAQASVQQAVSDSTQKAFTLSQGKQLHDAQMMTDNDFVAAQAGFAQSRASLLVARVNLEKAQQDLRYTYVYAPIDGIVVQRNVDVGQTVASSFSAPQLFLIASDLKKMQILVQVDEADIGQIAKGQQVRFTVQSYPNRTFLGTVQQVRLQSAVVQNVVDYSVVVMVDNLDGKLLPGMTATVNFQTAKASAVLRVPNAALRFRATAAMLAATPATTAGSAASGAGAGRDSAQGVPGVGAGRDSTRGTGAGAGGAGRDSTQRRQGTGQGGQSASGARPGGGAGRSGITVLWYLDAKGQPASMRVRTGLSDGQLTEITSRDVNLKEGLKVIAAVTNEKAGTAASSPFQQQQPQGGGMQRRVL